MNRMNSCMDNIEEFVKTNVHIVTDNKKGKQVLFSNQLRSQATANPRNQGASSSLIHNVNHVHIDNEAMEIALAISSLQSGKDLLDPCKDHPMHQGSIDEETPILIAQQDSDSKDEEEPNKAEPNPNTYKPLVPYSQVLNRPRANVTESHDHLLEAFQKVTITIPLIDVINHIPSDVKFLKGICTSHRNPKRIRLSETVSSIMMNSRPK